MNHTTSLTENYIFRRLYRAGKCSLSPYTAVYVKKNRQKKNRLGITATKKIGNAVQRNRARRIIKEAYRLLEPDIGTGFDIVIVARQRAVYAKMQAVKDGLKELLPKI